MSRAALKLSDLLPTKPKESPDQVPKVSWLMIQYDGSLTSPPCDEDVKWIVFGLPLNVSQRQIDALRAKHQMNARMPQPLNGRTLVVEDGE